MYGDTNKSTRIIYSDQIGHIVFPSSQGFNYLKKITINHATQLQQTRQGKIEALVMYRTSQISIRIVIHGGFKPSYIDWIEIFQ